MNDRESERKSERKRERESAWEREENVVEIVSFSIKWNELSYFVQFNWDFQRKNGFSYISLLNGNNKTDLFFLKKRKGNSLRFVFLWFVLYDQIMYIKRFGSNFLFVCLYYRQRYLSRIILAFFFKAYGGNIWWKSRSVHYSRIFSRWEISAMHKWVILSPEGRRKEEWKATKMICPALDYTGIKKTTIFFFFD